MIDDVMNESRCRDEHMIKNHPIRIAWFVYMSNTVRTVLDMYTNQAILIGWFFIICSSRHLDSFITSSIMILRFYEFSLVNLWFVYISPERSRTSSVQGPLRTLLSARSRTIIDHCTLYTTAPRPAGVSMRSAALYWLGECSESCTMATY